MKRGWVIVLLLSLGLNLGLGLSLLRTAPPPPPPRADGPPPPLDQPLDRAEVERFLQHRLDRMAVRLDLSEEQQAALWSLHLEDGGQVLSRRRELQRARAALQDLYAAGEPTLAQIHAAQQRISALQAALDSVVVEVMFHERAILTEEQRQQYRGLFATPREAPRGRWDRGGRSHQGGPRGERPARPRGDGSD